MGVEQLIRDRFVAAQAYADQFGGLDAFRHTSGVRSVDGPHPDYARFAARRDLELEALAQILAGSRLIHCHSYRQDEIVMLTHIARDYKFRIGTFQHVLEGYKVAPEIREHALGASAFTDWWAFKVEVQDAIPYGPPLMEEVGVVVSYNSDSNELARRMNTEATKAVRYSFGRISPPAALDFVTRNPAIQLGVESRIGSLAQGMDADVAVWSGDPLSTYARCEMTFVDGRRLFSLEQDAASNAWIARERERLIQKILDENRRRPAEPASEAAPGAPGQPGRDLVDTRPPTGLEHLSAAQRAALQRHLMDTLAAGKDPYYAPGLCGCGFPHF
jgi:N-acetylglucosamine-6-phosphate deacetylase